MLVFVDYEHADYRGEWAQMIQAARTWITYRLEDLSGLHTMLVRYDRISPGLLERIDARAIFISGQASDPGVYRPAELAPLREIVRTSGLPVFGLCGGWQFLAQALGARLEPIAPTEAQSAGDSIVQWPSGPAEFGYHAVDVLVDHPLLDGLERAPIVRHAHALHVPDPPDGFEVLAATDVCPVQMAVDGERKLVGTQFHPEYWTDEHPAGRRLLENFLRWSGAIGGDGEGGAPDITV